MKNKIYEKYFSKRADNEIYDYHLEFIAIKYFIYELKINKLYYILRGHVGAIKMLDICDALSMRIIKEIKEYYNCNSYEFNFTNDVEEMAIQLRLSCNKSENILNDITYLKLLIYKLASAFIPPTEFYEMIRIEQNAFMNACKELNQNI